MSFSDDLVGFVWQNFSNCIEQKKFPQNELLTVIILTQDTSRLSLESKIFVKKVNNVINISVDDTFIYLKIVKEENGKCLENEKFSVLF